MKSYMLTALFSMITTSAMASSYQAQTDVSYGWADSDFAGLDISVWQAKQRFYLAPVQTDGAVPLAEAAFMQRQSSLAASFNRMNVDLNGVDFGDGRVLNQNFHQNSWGLGGEYMDRSHNYYAALDMVFVNNSKSYEATTKLGYFVHNDWLVTADIYHIKDASGTTRLEYGASTKKLLALDSGDFISLTGGFRNIDDSTMTTYDVGADYYFGKNLSVGLGYEWNSAGVFQTNDDSYEVRSNWFVLPNLAFNASVGWSNTSGADRDSSFYQIGASYRF